MQTAHSPNEAATPNTAKVLDDASARQLGEWIAAELPRITGATITKDQLKLTPPTASLVGKIVYDACVQYQQEGHFPVDVSMFGKPATP